MLRQWVLSLPFVLRFLVATDATGGERFLVIRAPADSAPASQRDPLRVDVVLNWLEELEARVPTGG